jgi:hypothetical protein
MHVYIMMRQQSKRVGIMCILVRWFYQLPSASLVTQVQGRKEALASFEHDLYSEVAEVARSVH